MTTFFAIWTPDSGVELEKSNLIDKVRVELGTIKGQSKNNEKKRSSKMRVAPWETCL